MTPPDGPLHLRRNRMIGVIAAASFLSVGAVLLVASVQPVVRPMGLVLAAVLIIPGVWSVPLLLRPWRLDSQGLSLGRRRVMEWSQVTAVHVDDVRPQGAGRGPARVALTLRGDGACAHLVLYSQHDAREVEAFLGRHLRRDVPGRELLGRISQAWSGIR